VTERDLDAFLGATPRRRMARWATAALLLAAAAAALWLLVRFVDGPEMPYYSAPLERGSLTPALSAQGTIHAADEVTLRAEQDGVVRSLLGPGDGVVRAGQPIAVFDTTPLEAALASAEAAGAAADGAVAAAQVNADAARAKLDRYEGVWRRSQGRVPAVNEMEAARTALAQAAAAVAQADAARALARQRAAEARERLAGATVRAPFDGIVVSRAVAPGQLVRPGTPLVTLASGLDRLIVRVPLRGEDAQRIAANARARVLLAASTDKVRAARLVRIEPASDAPGTDRVALFALDAAPSATKGTGEDEAGEVVLRPGMAANVEIDLPARAGVLLVPNAALGFTPEGVRPRTGVIYILDGDNEPRQVAVATGASDGKRTEILAAALEPGAEVIIGRRTPGEIVRPGSPRGPAVK
jgi:HlyD family secretion protein